MATKTGPNLGILPLASLTQRAHTEFFFYILRQATYIVAVNDAFTTQAWKEKLGSSSPTVHFLADDTGAVS